MMKKIYLAAALSLFSSGAFAACTNPLSIKDGTAATVTMSVSTNADGFCAYSFNLAQINGVAPLMGNGVTGTGSPRVTIASDNTPFSVNLGTIGGAATAAAQTTAQTSLGAIATSVASIDTKASAPLPTQAASVIIGGVGIDQTTDGTTNGVSVKYSGTKLVADPCQQVALVRNPISMATAVNLKFVTGTASKKTYICGMMLLVGGTTNVAIVEGSGTNCGTSALGLIGGATAATGLILTAQAGFNSPPAGYAIAATTVNANDICLINSAAIQVSGYIVTATP